MSRSSLNCAAAIFNIRSTLQNYKNGEVPEVEFYKVSQHDLLEMLEMTMMAWEALENIQRETQSLISGLIEAVKKE